MTAVDRRLAATFAAQHGLVTRAQVLAAGGGDDLIRRRRRQGAWQRAERAVYATATHPWTWHRHLTAVALSIPRSYASHRAAARLLGVGDFTLPPIELSVPDGCRPRRDFAGRAETAGVPVIIHEIEDIALEAPHVIDGIPTAPPVRLAVDIGTLVSPARFHAIVGQLMRDHGIGWLELERCWQRHSRRGRNGCGPLHELLDAHFAATGAPPEVIESRCSAILVGAGLPAPVPQFRVARTGGGHAFIDLAYPDRKIGIENEGAVHDRPGARQRDHQRRNDLQLDGWQLFHFTWADVTQRERHVASVVERAYRAREPTFSP